MDDDEMDDNGMGDAVDVSEDSGGVHLPILDSACLACKDGNLPTGAHKCIICSQEVHILPGCSESCGEAEGYGENRICTSCCNKKIIQKERMISEMKHCEKWSRKSKREVKKSKYLMPAPNWNIDRHINKAVKTGFLINGMKSLRIFKSGDQNFSLQSTNSFDALAQVIFGQSLLKTDFY